MKIRSGFVSNSSSSSFILIGKKVDIKDITEKDISNKKYVCVGQELGDGDDIFYIDDIETLWFLKATEKINVGYEHFGGFEVFETFTPIHSIEHEMKFNSKDLPKGELVATSYWQDYSSSKSVSDLFDKYVHGEDIEVKFKSAYKKFQRKDKLNKIEKK